jgi:PAS domain S-box-containing protein
MNLEVLGESVTGDSRQVPVFDLLECLGQDAWQKDLETNRLQVSTSFCRTLGYDVSTLPPSAEAAQELIHAADVVLAAEEVELHLQSGQPFELEVRALSASGEWRFIRVRGCITQWSCDGRPAVISGILKDVTDAVAAARTQRIASKLIATLSQRERQVLDCLMIGAGSGAKPANRGRLSCKATGEAGSQRNWRTRASCDCGRSDQGQRKRLRAV